MAEPDEIRSRLAGDAAPDMELWRAALADPGLVALAKGKRASKALQDLRELIADLDHRSAVLADALPGLSDLGWGLCGDAPSKAYAAAAVLISSGDLEGAEAAIESGWEDVEVLLRNTPSQMIGRLGTWRDPYLGPRFMHRRRLLEAAWEHHVAERYEASIPLVMAQIDGITSDATATIADREGRVFFSRNPRRSAEVVDATTLAGHSESLGRLRDKFSQGRRETSIGGSFDRHGIAHGRELTYDTRRNSLKTWVLLRTMLEWAQPLIKKLVEQSIVEHDAEWAGSDAVDEIGRRKDQRGFAITRDALRNIWLLETRVHEVEGRFFELDQLISHPFAPIILSPTTIDRMDRVVLTADGWWASAQSESGWHFAVGSSAAEPQEMRMWDGAAAPSESAEIDAWYTEEPPNWLSADSRWAL